MQVKALNLPLRTSMPTRVCSLVSVMVDDGGSKCKRGRCMSGKHVEPRPLSEFWGCRSLIGRSPIPRFREHLLPPDARANIGKPCQEQNNSREW